MIKEEEIILEAITNKQNRQVDIANLYSQLIIIDIGLKTTSGHGVNWLEINQAIQARWSGKSALERVKKMAWEAKINLNGPGVHFYFYKE